MIGMIPELFHIGDEDGRTAVDLSDSSVAESNLRPSLVEVSEADLCGKPMMRL